MSRLLSGVGVQENLEMEAMASGATYLQICWASIRSALDKRGKESNSRLRNNPPWQEKTEAGGAELPARSFMIGHNHWEVGWWWAGPGAGMSNLKR